jgi:hypothetical protein
MKTLKKFASYFYYAFGILFFILINIERFATVFEHTDMIGYLYFKLIYRFWLFIFATFGILALIVLYSMINPGMREFLNFKTCIWLFIVFLIIYIGFPGKHLDSNMREFIQLYPKYSR